MPASPSASVFINCPFDQQYQPLFEAIVFCVVACGFVPRITLDLTDAGEVRIENIYRLIAQCNPLAFVRARDAEEFSFGVHIFTPGKSVGQVPNLPTRLC